MLSIKLRYQIFAAVAFVLIALVSVVRASDQITQFAQAPQLVFGEPLKTGSRYRYNNVAPGYDATVEVLRTHLADLVSIDDNSRVSHAFRPRIIARTPEAYAEFAIELIPHGSSESNYRKWHASLVELSDKITTIYNVSDYTLEANSRLLATVEPPDTLHVIADQLTHGDSLQHTESSIAVSLSRARTLTVRFTAKTAGELHGAVMLDPVGFTAPVFYNLNDFPVAADDNHVVIKNQKLEVSARRGLLANDYDADIVSGQDSLSVESFEINSATHLPDTTVSTTEGAVTISHNGAYRFIPAVNYTGNVSGITYRVIDTKGGYDHGELSLITLDRSARAIAAVSTLGLQVTEDTNGDGYINKEELSGRIEVSISLPDQATSGQSVLVSTQFETVATVLDEGHLASGVVITSFETPVDGTILDLSAMYIDDAGEVLSQTVDQVNIDLTASDKPEIEIVEDIDNSGFLSENEYRSELTVVIQLPSTAVVNDQVTLSYGDEQHTVVLTPIDVAEQSVRLSIPVVSEGQTFSLTASITDEAGNISQTGSDSIQVDTTPPPLPSVNTLVSSSATPRITGALPVDHDYLLSVEVNAITYVVGDGHLQKRPQGLWELLVPDAESLPHGVYDVKATVTDIAGNSTSDNTVRELTVDLEAPTLAIENVGLSSDAAPVLRGTSDQNDGQLVVVSNASGQSLCVAVVGQGDWQCAVRRTLVTGENNLIATAQDSVGNRVEQAFLVRVATATDTDSDGIPDDIEGTADTDADGVPDYKDLDSDNDGILDQYETVLDIDLDGIRDYRDPDSDNDSVSDAIEGGHGLIPEGLPVNADGIIVRTVEFAVPVDSDNDQIADFRDLDSDNDGAGDELENTRTDEVTSLAPTDTDHDRIPDYRDLDSDQDGLPDVSEQFLADADGDGRVDEFIDLNVDGLADFIGLNNTAIDTDNDGFANIIDIDSDGDTRSDLIESGGTDTDSDGRLDDFRDHNNNGIADSVDQFYTNGSDVDGDFIDDLYDTDHTFGEDADADGIVDAFDVDADGDGLLDLIAGTPQSNSISKVYEFDPVAGALLNTGTGTLGGGCSIQRSGLQIDWSLLLLLGAALLGITRRRWC